MTQYHTNGKKSSSDEEPGDAGPNGFHAIPRKMLHPHDPLHPYNEGSKMSPWGAWLDLTARARWKADPESELDRGELRDSQRFLARRWNWSPAKVCRFLDRLEAMGRIERIPTPGPSKSNRVRIVDYDDLFTPRNTGERETGERNRVVKHDTAQEHRGGDETLKQGDETGGRNTKLNQGIIDEPRDQVNQKENQAGEARPHAPARGDSVSATGDDGDETPGENSGGNARTRESEAAHQETPEQTEDSGRNEKLSARAGDPLDSSTILLDKDPDDGFYVEIEGSSRNPTYLPPGVDAEDVEADLDLRRTLAKLPVKIAEHPEGHAWKLGISKYGPYALLELPGPDDQPVNLPANQSGFSVLNLLDPPDGSTAEKVLGLMEDTAPPSAEIDRDYLAAERWKGIFGYAQEYRPAAESEGGVGRDYAEEVREKAEVV